MDAVKLNSTLLSDCKTLSFMLGSQLKRIALFGSYTRNPNVANDIDIALFIESENIHDIRVILEDVDLSLPIRCSSLNGGYVKTEKHKDRNMLDYHFILLDAVNPNCEFMEKSGKHLINVDLIS